MAEHSKTRPPQTGCPQFRAWLQLMRIANLPTAISNVAAGYALVHFGFDIVPLAALILVSCLCYCGGMILNDAFDTSRDSQESPERPIPRGAISQRSAFRVGFSMLGAALLVTAWPSMYSWPVWLPFAIVTVLIVMIVLYDGFLKSSWFGPLAMGSCRSLNLLLGGCVGALTSIGDNGDWAITSDRLLTYALLIGIYVTGVTLLARNERQLQQSRIRLAVAAAIILASLAGIACLTALTKNLFSGDLMIPLSRVDQAVAVCVALVSVPIARRLMLAVTSLNRKHIGRAIGLSLSSLIFLDAAVVFLALPQKPLYAGVVALLIVPVTILKRFSAQT